MYNFCISSNNLFIAFLAELWLLYPNKIEEQESTATGILSSFKKAAKEKNSVSYTAISLLFRLLDNFALNKDPFAPVVYKAIIFSLFENFNNQNKREFIFKNMKQIFEANDQVPLNIIFEPLLKELQVSENILITLNIPDLEFLVMGAKNPKLNIKLSIQLLDILAKIYLNNVAFAHMASTGLTSIISRFIDVQPMQEFVTKFSKIALAIFFTSEKNKRPLEEFKPKYNSKAVNTRPPPTNAEFEKEIIGAQKRALIIELMKSIITLGNDSINPRIKTILLYTHFQLKQLVKREHRGILMLLGIWGNPSDVIAEFEKSLQSNVAFVKINASGIGSSDPGGVLGMGNSLDPIKQSQENDPNTFLRKLDRSALSLDPDAEGEEFLHHLGVGSKKKFASNINQYEQITKKGIRADPKILEEIQSIKQKFQEKVQKEKNNEEINKEKLELTKKKLRVQLEKRSIEHGIGLYNKTDVTSNIIFEFNSRNTEKLIEKNIGLPEIEILNLDAEEDRDKEAVWIIIKKYGKVMKYLFNAYTNSAYVGAHQLQFDKKQEKRENIFLPDLWKLIMDHNCKKLITKDELSILFKLVNQKIMKKTDVQTLDYDGFHNLFIQLAIFIYSRPPNNLGHMPIYIPVQKLFNHFRDAEVKQGKSIILYDDPDSTDPGDKDLNKLMNENIKQNPEYPLPEAYRKVYEKNLEVNFILPKPLTIDEKYKISMDIIDEILFKNFGYNLFSFPL